MAQFAVFLEGVEDLNEIKQLKPRIRTAAVRAINKTARDGRAIIAREIRAQINFPASYVAPGQKRLYVSKQATRGDLEGEITARARNTSLSRFVTSRPGKGVTVEVNPGRTRFMRRAFLVKLRSGNALTDTKYNMGLAIRLRPGERLENKRSLRLAKGLYLLYGPSVDQVFRAASGEGVATDKIPELEDRMAQEFLRLVEL